MTIPKARHWGSGPAPWEKTLSTTISRRLLLLAAATLLAACCALVASAVAPSMAHACVVYPETLRPCAVDPPPDPGPPPPEPDCSLDESPPGYLCKPGPSVSYDFVGVDTTRGTDAKTICTVTMRGATPPDQEFGEQIQFETSAKCDHVVRSVTIDTRLQNPVLTDIAFGTQGRCHQFTDPNCGLSAVGSRGSAAGWGPGVYHQVAIVRLALPEENAGDPWEIIPPGTTPAGSPMGEECKPGSWVVRCELRMEIEADGV